MASDHQNDQSWSSVFRRELGCSGPTCSDAHPGLLSRASSENPNLVVLEVGSKCLAWFIVGVVNNLRK